MLGLVLRNPDHRPLRVLVQLAEVHIFETFLRVVLTPLVASQFPIFGPPVDAVDVSINSAALNIKSKLLLSSASDLEACVLHHHDVHWGKVICRDFEDSVDARQ